MATFICNECGNQQTGFPGMPPAYCNRCKKNGRIWSANTTSSPKEHGGTSSTAQVTRPSSLDASVNPTVEGTASRLKEVSTIGQAITKADAPVPPLTSVSAADSSSHSNPIHECEESTTVANSFEGNSRQDLTAIKSVAQNKIDNPLGSSVPSPENSPQLFTEVRTPVLVDHPHASTPKVPNPKPNHSPKRFVTKLRTRRLIWELSNPYANKVLPQRTCPAVDPEGRVYFSYGNRLRACDHKDGKLATAWEYETAGRLVGAPVIGPDHVIRVHSEDGNIYSITQAGKSAFAALNVGRPLGWTTPLVDRWLNVWIAHCSGGLWRIVPNADAAMRYLKSRHKMDCSGVILDNVLYIGSENACVFAVELNEQATNIWNSQDQQGRAGWYINSALAIGHGPTIVVTSRQNEVITFQLNGRSLWRIQLEGLILGSPVIGTRGEIYVGVCLTDRHGECRGELLQIDGRTGKICWRFPTSASIESTAVLGDDSSIYFGDNDGGVYALDQDGRLLWKEEMSAGVRSPGTLLPGGTLVFGLENGAFIGLKTDSQGLASGLWPKFLSNLANLALQ